MILLQDNLEILAPKPMDQKYGPYASDTDAINAIPLSYRHKGLTVGVLNNSGSVIEYWWQNGIADVDLVQKVTGGGSVDLSNYYTISQVNTLLNTKANTAHTHLAADITDLSSAVLSITDSRFDGIDSLISTIQNYTLTPNNGLELLTVNDKPAAGNISLGIANNGVTFARMQQLPATSIIGNSTNATGNAQAITIGTGLAFDGTTLTSSVRNATNGLSLLSNNIELGGTLTKNTTVALSTFQLELGAFRFRGNNASANAVIDDTTVLSLRQTQSAYIGLSLTGSNINDVSAHATLWMFPGLAGYESFITSQGALNLMSAGTSNFRFRMTNSSLTIGRINTGGVSHTTHTNVLRLSTDTGDNLDLFNGSTNGSVRLNFTPNGSGSSLINTSGSSLGFQFSAITRITLNTNGIGIGTTPSTGFQFSISEASDVNLSLVSISNNVNIYSNTSIVFRDSTTGKSSFTLHRTGGIKMVASIANTITFTGSTVIAVSNPYNTTNVVVLIGVQSSGFNPRILSITSSQITFEGEIGDTLHYLILEKSSV